MARKAVKLTSFGSQSLESANFLQLRCNDPGPTPRDSLYLDVNGAMFDAAGSGANTLEPGQSIEVEIGVTATTAANFVTYSDQLLALSGTRATLTGEDANGGTITCTARCLAVPSAVNPRAHAGFFQKFKLHFRTVTNWA